MPCVPCQQARRALIDAAKAVIKGNPGETVSRIREAAHLATQGRSESDRIRAMTRRSN